MRISNRIYCDDDWYICLTMTESLGNFASPISYARIDALSGDFQMEIFCAWCHNRQRQPTHVCVALILWKHSLKSLRSNWFLAFHVMRPNSLSGFVNNLDISSGELWLFWKSEEWKYLIWIDGWRNRRITAVCNTIICRIYWEIERGYVWVGKIFRHKSELSNQMICDVVVVKVVRCRSAKIQYFYEHVRFLKCNHFVFSRAKTAICFMFQSIWNHTFVSTKSPQNFRVCEFHEKFCFESWNWTFS